MESGHAEWHISEVAMIEVVKSSAKNIHSICEEKGIELIEDYPAGISTFQGDRDRLMQVVINLLSNAVKFCVQEKGRVEILILIIVWLLPPIPSLAS